MILRVHGPRGHRVQQVPLGVHPDLREVGAVHVLPEQLPKALTVTSACAEVPASLGTVGLDEGDTETLEMHGGGGMWGARHSMGPAAR